MATYIVPMRLPALQPVDRILRMDQTSLSSHKNGYSGGVLTGNWIEERAAAGVLPPLPDASITATTVYRSSFTPPKPMRQPQGRSLRGVDRELLFGHGTSPEDRSLVTTHQLFHSDPYREMARTTPGLNTTTGGTVTRNELAERKRREWEADWRPNRFETTKGATIDRTGRSVLDGPLQGSSSGGS
eukprot:TRINITY_DN8566_c0_g1_i1.p1 TRINITY_DN8566_c0_g1~~TRINITY_DN8566_c0_g1_i1.p1  ORF type:complete len:186 (+),score=40.37 TRINITY_DN8566_c0_g1_i1:67-624(+)